ncbi:ABC transporter ATP-binding protein [Castellaniella sp.]|uniref:ABC transporter ATP-binding protein n=1 Tax=Castellaniella sp. TaxID=1955812 RepID=UPI002AFEA715|nr:ABC transporter ATP-binding protein [Castellaniella sp.]
MLELNQISLSYPSESGHLQVVKRLSLSLESGQIACLLGASGCGKTTVLRAIAGFEPLDEGEIRLKGRLLSSPGKQLEPEHRRVGMMFQDYALFPHLNIRQNVAFGLRRLAQAERTRRVDAMLELTDLQGLADRHPHQLSGGQQQRVALARALAPEPELLLLDEPFSNLDVDAREKLAFELRDILKATGRTALVVTHNQAEAFAMADRIGVMQCHCLAQWDTPYGLHNNPANPEIADFIRRESLLAQRTTACLRGSPTGNIPLQCSTEVSLQPNQPIRFAQSPHPG